MADARYHGDREVYARHKKELPIKQKKLSVRPDLRQKVEFPDREKHC